MISATALPRIALATEWAVEVGGTGDGTAAAPLGRIQDAIAKAMPGDRITVRPGTYSESLATVRAGTPAAPIVIAAATPRTVTVTTKATVMKANHANVVVDGLVMDAQYAGADAVVIDTGANGFVLRNAEVRKSTKDCVDIRKPSDVLIEGSLVHHCLNSAGGRTDAHGIVSGGTQRLTIRDTEVHTFSGDAFQIDPDRAPWSDVRIEGCDFWLAPLPAAENGFPAGAVTGENAIDTKTPASGPRSKLYVRNVRAHGFGGSTFLSNQAAFNIKENVDVVMDGVTVFGSDIGFRLRAPAQVTVMNAVVYDTARAVRYEDGIVSPRILNATFGANVTRPFQEASSSSTKVDVQNLLLLGTTLPTEANGPSNLATSAAAFVDAQAHDYHLAPSSPAIDTGTAVAQVEVDRDDVPRPKGKGVDRGAYEFCGNDCAPRSGGTGAGGAAGPNGGAAGADDGAGGSGGGGVAADDGEVTSDGAGGCRMAGAHARSATFGWLALLGTALVLRRARRLRGADAARPSRDA